MAVEAELVRRAEERVGTTVCGKYRIDRVLGVGGMAVVFAATDPDGQRFALKLLHPEFTRRTETVARFIREADASKAVGHPGAVAVLDVDLAEDGSVVLVMELLVGYSVETMWERGKQRLPPMIVLAVARELCEVLIAAHAAEIVHRDIKPANLFITDDGQLKVIDFGIARMRDADSPSLTTTGTVFGTPAFMAPEQASGLVSRTSPQTDIWAVGATMFALLTGRPVHIGETAQHVVLLSATTPAPSLASVEPSIDPLLVDIIDRALAFEPSNRWPSALVMKTAICTASEKLFKDSSPPLLTMMDTQERSLVMHEPKRLVGVTTFAGTAPTATDLEISRLGKTLVSASKRRRRLAWIVVGGIVAGTVPLAFLLPREHEAPPLSPASQRTEEPRAAAQPPESAGHADPTPIPTATASATASASSRYDRHASPPPPVPHPKPSARPTVTATQDDLQRSRK